MTSPTDLSRRRMLVAGSGALAAAGLAGASRVGAQTTPAAPAAASQAKPLPAYVAWKDADSLIVHTPTTIETKRTALGVGPITPAERLYIRNNIAAPDVSIVANRDAWQLVGRGCAPATHVDSGRTEDTRARNAGDGAAVLGQWPRIFHVEAQRNAMEGRRCRQPVLERCAGAGGCRMRSVE